MTQKYGSFTIWFSTFILLSSLPAISQDSSACGQPPRVDDESLEGDIQGKAKFLTSVLGRADASGKIKISRIDIFKQAPDGMKASADRYLMYMTCIFLMSDQNLSATSKIDQLIKINRSFSGPADK